MDKADRAKLIGALHRAKVGALAYVPSGRGPGPKYRPVKKATWGSWEDRGTPFEPEPWTTKPDAQPAAEMGHKHRQPGSPLNAIAARYYSASYRAETKRLDLYHA